MHAVTVAECVLQLLISIGTPLYNVNLVISMISLCAILLLGTYLWQSGTPKFPRCSHGAGTVGATSSSASTSFWIDTQTKAACIHFFLYGNPAK